MPASRSFCMRSIITKLRLRERRVEVAFERDTGSKLERRIGQEARGAAEDQPRAQTRQQQSVRAGHARMQDIAGNRYRDPRQSSGVHAPPAPSRDAQDGSQVQQRLRRMLVHSIAGIEYRQSGYLLQQIGSAGEEMPQNDALGSQGAKRDPRVFERLALFNRGRLRTDQGRIRAQALRRQLERGTRARARLVKQERDPPLLEPPGPNAADLRFRVSRRA